MMRLNATIAFLIITLYNSRCSQGYSHQGYESDNKSRRNSIRGTTTTSTITSTSTINSNSKKDNSFDFYVLSMSYQPEFCFQHRHEGWDGCENPMDFWRKSLTLHGLWPEKNDGSWPSMCTNEKFNTTTITTIGQTKFNTYWPNVRSSPSQSYIDYSFWDHEWTKHGTCSGLGQVEYFNNTLNHFHFLKTPSIVGERYGGSVSKKELLSAYSGDGDGDVVLVCVGGGKYLSEVRTCIGRNPDGTASKSVECIPEVEQEGNCGDVIKITKFYSDEHSDNHSDEHGIVPVDDEEVVEHNVGITNGLLESSSTS